MTSPELLIVSLLKALVEIAALALLAQGAIGVLAGASRQRNFAYRLLQVITAPLIRGARALAPPIIAERHLGLAAFFMLFWSWIALIYAKAYVCHAQHLACFAR